VKRFFKGKNLRRINQGERSQAWPYVMTWGISSGGMVRFPWQSGWSWWRPW